MSKYLLLSLLLLLATTSLLDAQIFVLPFIFISTLDKNKLPCLLRKQGSQED
ncbi:hypothetical protein [Piscibacillus halophilus]|uniref:Uncharacterized protein n=1 Tax=Piscibacillus halophilus TaxID=571933 RepID=A0A1H9G8P1_9BACI|nr:hypothetical protein [Piscibacillus halophilus]SEQ46525.1 hypothetical protein SAMN05216362_11459 [Piscibacillus halophilus]